jgi:DNA-binding response OmpR family regulator
VRGLRVAVLDSDPGLLEGLAARCRREQWHLLGLGARGLEPQRLLASRPNVLIVDPRAAGPKAGERIGVLCATVPELPVIVCTARSSAAERIAALRVGVDDWITKPCDPEEILARAEAISRQGRRIRPHIAREPIRIGELEFRPGEHGVLAGGRRVELTARECDVLLVLAAARGVVLEREAIYQAGWGYSMPWGDRSVDVFVQKLRRKLERISPDFAYIHTHHRLGYRLDPAPLLPGRAENPPGRRRPVLPASALAGA